MTRRTALKRFGALGLGFIALTTPVAASRSGRTVRIRFNHTDGVGGEAFHFAEKFKKLAAERSDGRITVENFHTGELGAERDMYDSLEIGAIEMGRTGSLIIPVVTPEYGALDIPYIFRSQQHLRNVLAGSIGGAMHQEILSRKGIRVLALGNRGPRHLTTAGREVRVPADLRGLKLRVPEIPVYIEAWRALGASPVPMAFPEVFLALQKGVIDGQENPLGTIFGNRFQEVQRYLILTAHVRGTNWLVASERFWLGLSEDDRQLLQTAATDAALYADEQGAKRETGLLQQLQEAGMTVVQPDTQPFAEIVLREVPPRFEAGWKPGLVEQILRTDG